MQHHRRKPARATVVAWALLLVIVLPNGCDDFVLYDELEAAQQESEALTEPEVLRVFPSDIILNTNYTITFATVGGTPPYSFTATLGTVDSDGRYTAPAVSGTDTVEVTDGAGDRETATVEVYEPFLINPTSLSLATDDTHSFFASGGNPPYTFSIDPPALGNITPDGSYTAPATAGSDIVRVTDALGNTSLSNVTVSLPGALIISPVSITVLETSNITFTASGGTKPYTFSKISGSGSITADGEYTAGGAGEAWIRVRDDAGTQSDAVVTVVGIGPLSINPTDVRVEQGDSMSFYPSGGVPPYVYSVASGSGLINASSGEYTAPVMMPAVQDTIVRLTDSQGTSATTSVTILLAKPTELDASAASSSRINLTWLDNSVGEDGFEIARLMFGSYVVIDTVAADQTFYQNTGLSDDTKYYYRVRAFKGSEYSDWSNVASERTPD